MTQKMGIHYYKMLLNSHSTNIRLLRWWHFVCYLCYIRPLERTKTNGRSMMMRKKFTQMIEKTKNGKTTCVKESRTKCKSVFVFWRKSLSQKHWIKLSKFLCVCVCVCLSVNRIHLMSMGGRLTTINFSRYRLIFPHKIHTTHLN